MCFYVSAKYPDELKKKIQHQLENGVPVEDVSVFVTTDVRKQWILNQDNLIIDDQRYNVCFEDTGGDIWRAYLHYPRYNTKDNQILNE